MKKIKVLFSAFISSLVFVPALAFAQSPSSTGVSLNSLSSALQDVGTLINRVIPLLVGVAVVIFIFGIVRFILAAGDAEKRTEGRKYMVYSIIAIAVMLSVWALVAFVRNTFGLTGQNNTPTDFPQIPPVR
jgi:hypothetical protein